MTSISLRILFASPDPDARSMLITTGIVSAMVVVVPATQIAALLKFYRIQPPGCALVQEGNGGSKVAVGSGILVVSILHRCHQFPVAAFERFVAQQGCVSENSPATRFIDGVEEALNTIGFTVVACRRQ